MAMPARPALFGIDVAKAELVIYHQDQDAMTTLPNEAASIRRWLKTVPANSAIALEATGTYHRVLLESAHALGHRMFVVDGYQLSNYRKSIGGRAKTDPSDARLLARYLEREGQDLRPWSPPPKAYRVLQSLLRRRAALVQARVAIQQSCAGEAVLKGPLQRLLRQVAGMERLIQTRILIEMRTAGLTAQLTRCQAIEGIGPLTGAALVMAFLRGDFRTSDAFIAFLGLDVRVRDSGQHSGRRKLTKKGDAEVRRLLHNAAMAARRNPFWAAYYQRYRDRGLKPTQVLVILARKLARIAFALMKNQTEYRRPEACLPT